LNKSGISNPIRLKHLMINKAIFCIAALLLFGFGTSKAQKVPDSEFTPLFNGKNLDGWIGNKSSYRAENGIIIVDPKGGGGGNLFTEKEYGNFILRFEFLLTPGANNGLGIHAPLEGDAAYVGKELQILDNEAEKYANLHEYQFHGSVYGVMPAKRGFLKAPGEWNQQEVIVEHPKIKGDSQRNHHFGRGLPGSQQKRDPGPKRSSRSSAKQWPYWLFGTWRCRPLPQHPNQRNTRNKHSTITQ
jgi:hypothetical protein